MKNYYLNQMVDCIHRTDSVVSYSKGVFYTYRSGKYGVARTLHKEMVEKHPVKGRLMDLGMLPILIHLALKQEE